MAARARTGPSAEAHAGSIIGTRDAKRQGITDPLYVDPRRLGHQST